MDNPSKDYFRFPRWSAAILVVGLTVLTACTHGRDWDTYGLEIVTDPPGADCTFERNGVKTEAHRPTPVEVVLTTGHGWIQITCSRTGHNPASRYVSGFFEGTVYLTLPPTSQAQTR